MTSTVSVLLGNGDGTFRTRIDTGVGKRPTSVALADLDGDGRQDLAVGYADASQEYSIAVSVGAMGLPQRALRV